MRPSTREITNNFFVKIPTAAASRSQSSAVIGEAERGDLRALRVRRPVHVCHIHLHMHSQNRLTNLSSIYNT